ncbi:MAG: hypothetical protein SFZ23_10890 [Planctomycetota bacterium]|nr:hypothetical protein [Planctomycetota bacterium]
MLPPRTLIVSDGGLVGLLACALAREGVLAYDGPEPQRLSMPLLWIPRFRCSLGTGALRAAALERHAELLALTPARSEFEVEAESLLGEAPASEAEDIAHERAPSLAGARALLDACQDAGVLECSRVVWACTATDHEGRVRSDALARVLNRALLVARLAGVEGVTLDVHTPVADLAMSRVADLVQDLGVPVEEAWWSRALEGAMNSTAHIAHTGPISVAREAIERARAIRGQWAPVLDGLVRA